MLNNANSVLLSVQRDVQVAAEAAHKEHASPAVFAVAGEHACLCHTESGEGLLCRSPLNGLHSGRAALGRNRIFSVSEGAVC